MDCSFTHKNDTIYLEKDHLILANQKFNQKKY